MKKIVGCLVLSLSICQASLSQVDTSFIYKAGTPFGTLDLRIAKSASRYYYLQEDKTFSFREDAPGVRTNTYRNMTSWDSSPYKQGNLREKNGSSDSFIMNYRLLSPASYNASYSAGYPMIIMMHGAGERGNCWDSNCFWDTRSWKPATNTPAAPTEPNHELLNNDYNLLHGGSIHLHARNLAGSRQPNDPGMPQGAFPGFVLFPQNLNGWDGNTTQDAIRIIRLLVKKYNIDPNRIYVHGLSNGGMGTYEVIKRAPWLFAAALPMSAPSETSIISKGLRPQIAHIPLWIFQGGLDTAPTPAKTQGFVKSFRDAGAIVRLTEYANLGHGVWNTAYKEPDFFTWILGQNKSNIHVFAGISAICQTTNQGVRMEVAAGFHKYEWERNGSVIAGATTAAYVANLPGTYRARFSRKANPGAADWNRWSDPVQVTSQSPTAPEISQRGSVVLKGLDNYGNAHLRAEGDFSRYYWYKDGVLVNLPGSQDDTTRHVKFTAGSCTGGPCAGNGAYTLVVAGADNCTSPPSKAKYLFFNNQAPVNINAPSDFTGATLANAKVNLTWKDLSGNENGFEVWRRRQTGPTTWSIWEMAPLAAPNTTAMVDQGLLPASTYQYKIRAVGNAGRSNYTPAASNQYLVITTSDDTQAPTSPQSLTATSTGIRKINLTWQASTDNTGIREYVIYYGSTVVNTGSPAASYQLTNLPLNADLTFTVRARDHGNNLSGASNPASASTSVTGLYYQHSTGAFSSIDLIDWSVAEFEGTVPNFTLSPRTQQDYFNFQFDGYLYITKSGTYQFQTYSDDGSRLTLNEQMLVNNDGQHGPRTVTSNTVTLNSGPHLINVKYFEFTSGQALAVKYKGPDTGNNWIVIPDAALRSDSGTGATMMASGRAASPEQAVAAEAPEPVALRADIYPNPSTPADQIHIQANGTSQPMSITLLDMMGKPYYESTLSAEDAGAGIQILPRQQLTKGMYIMVIRQGDTTLKQKVIIKE